MWAPEKTDDSLPRLCEQLAGPGGDATGAFHVAGEGGTPAGVILMERGKVCWAVAAGFERLLTELLMETHGLSEAELSMAYRECRDHQIPLGTWLVDHGVLTSQELEAVVIRHTAETFRRIAKQMASGSEWRPHKAGGYQPSVTFSVHRIVAHASALSHGVDASEVERELLLLADGAYWVAAYAPGASLPLAVVEDQDVDVQCLREVGRFMARATGVLARAGVGARALTATVSSGCLVAVERSDFWVAAACADFRRVARFLNKNGRDGYGGL